MDINSMSSAYEPNRITGMSSGLDTDSLVKKMLKPDEIMIDKAKQDEQLTAWKQEEMVDIISDLKDFKKNFDILSPNNLMTSKNYAGCVATSSSSTELTAQTFAGAARGTYNVYINSVAKSAISLTDGEVQTADGKKASNNTKLSDIKGFDDKKTSLTIKVNDKEFVINGIKGTDTISDLVNKIKSSSTKNDESFLKFANVSFSDLTGKLTVIGNKTGKGESISVEGDIAKNLKLNSAKGQDADISIIPPGCETTLENLNNYRISSSTNNLSVDNITYTIGDVQEPSTELKGGKVVNINSKPITVKVAPDSTDEVKKIKAFVDQYNKLIDKINGKLNEKQQFKYKPLSEEQKKAMSKDDVKEWESKAKQGLLKNNMMLSSLLSDMRSIFYTKVKDSGIMITDLGISTTDNYRDGGKLQVDEKKLKNALENKSEQVQRLFTDNTDGKNGKGIFVLLNERLEKSVSSFDGNLVKFAGYNDSRWAFNNELSKKIKDKNKIIEDMEEKMYKRQEQLYNQFAELESAMAKFSSQSSYLAGMMPQGN